MPKKFLSSVTKKVINERSFLCVKLGKTISSKEIKKLRTYMKGCLEEFSFEEAVPEE